jgi:predicted DNA-binding protein YlxM (UPF0122 family)
VRFLRRLAERLAVRYIEATTATTLNRVLTMRRKGKIRVTLAEYQQLLWTAQDKGPEAYANVQGWSPSYVAAFLGVTRQSVAQAIDRGTLTAYYIEEDSGAVTSIIITDASMRAFLARRKQAA